MLRYKWTAGVFWQSVRMILKEIINGLLGLCVFVVIILAIYIAYDADEVASSTVIDEELMQYAPSDENFNWDDVKTINQDIVAWIRIDGTSIDYPVLQAHDNDYYLSRNYHKDFATAGSIFLDYRDDFLNDNFLIIYGHRMSRGGMFSDVTKYSDARFFDEHLDGEIFGENGANKLKVVGFAKIKNNSELYALHKDAFWSTDYIRNRAIIWMEDNVDTSHFLLLSTCDGEDKTMRDILLLNVL